MEGLRFAVPAEGLAPLLRVMLAERLTLLLSAIASLEGRLADLAEDDLCGVPLGVDWPWLAEAPLCALLLKATDGRAGAAKDIWVSLLLVLVCDIASVTVLHTTSVYTSPIDG